MGRYIIAYDIADVKRLARLARRLEKVSIRIQHSIFYAHSFTQQELYATIDTINDCIDSNEDDVRIYTVMEAGVSLGQAIDLDNPFLIT